MVKHTFIINFVWGGDEVFKTYNHHLFGGGEIHIQSSIVRGAHTIVWPGGRGEV